MSKAVTKQQSNALATNNLSMSGSGMDNTDLQIPVAYLYQGTAKERKEFPNASPGDILDKLTGEKIESTKFIPIHVYKSWVKFTKQDGLVYIETDRSRVPQADLEWGDDGTAPAATETYNYYLMFEGHPYPVVFRFKKTSIKAGKRLWSLEQLSRKALGKGVGLYEMGFEEHDGAEGPYLVPTVKPIGDPGEDILLAATQFAGAIRGGQTTEVGDDTDDLPI